MAQESGTPLNLLNLKDASKSFGERVILDCVTAGIDAGHKVGLIGENGAGKSTLLKILSGLETLDDGQLMIRGELAIAYVAQEPELRQDVRARDIIAEPLAELVETIGLYERLAGACDPAADDALERIEVLGGWDWEHRVERAALATGVDELDAQVSRLSGGERKRVALARMLVEKEKADIDNRPMLILLDEPTNHLDATTVEWLERWISDVALAAIIVTHDRYFLDSAANRMLEVREGGLRGYEGGFTEYLEARAIEESHRERVQHRRLNILKTELEWARRSPKARTSKSKSRLKDVAAKGKQVKEELARRQEQANFTFGDSPRLGKTILELQNVGKRFVEDEPLLDGLNLILRKGDRIGIVGPNGGGKSTLLRIIAGMETPDVGTCRLGTNTKLAYFDQHRTVLDDDLSVRDTMAPDGDYVFIGGTEKVHVASWLDRFAFKGDVLRMPTSRLSGGERNRLAIAKFLLEPANVLLLDEPTNDLDIYTLAILEAALIGFQGCVLTVSHDRYFLDKVATAVLAFERDLTGKAGQVTLVEGDYTTYRRLRLATLEAQALARAEQKRTGVKPTPEVEKKAGKTAGPKLTWAEEKELGGLEPRMEAIEAEVAELEVAVGAAEVWLEDGAQGRALTETLDAKRLEYDALMSRWAELSERTD